RTASGVIGTDCTAAFSLTPAQDYAEAVLCDAEGGVLESALVELPGMSGLTDASPVTEEELQAARAMQAQAMQTTAGEVDGWPAAGHAAGAAANGAAPRKPAEPPGVSPGDGPVLPAGDSIEWLTGA